MNTLIRRKGAVAALLAAVAATATEWGYVSVINEQNGTPPNPGVVPFISAYIAAIAAAAVLGLVLILSGRPNSAEPVIVAAAAGSGALGILAIFSIGLALVITAILLAVAAAGAAPRPRRPAGWVLPLVGSLIALAILASGLALANA